MPGPHTTSFIRTAHLTHRQPSEVEIAAEFYTGGSGLLPRATGQDSSDPH